MKIEDDKILIKELTESYRSQFIRYRDLRDLTRRLMGKLVLSRGDLSVVEEALLTKRQMLEAIEAERARVAGLVKEWERRKELIPRGAETDMLNEALTDVAGVIREFLDDETQLCRYIENLMTPKAVSDSSVYHE